MASLFNISSRYLSLFEQLDAMAQWEPDTDADGNYIDFHGNVIDDAVEYRRSMIDALFDTIDSVDGELNDKLANCGSFIKQLTAEAGALDDEIKSLRERSAAKKREIERMKQYIMSCMDAVGCSKIDEPLAKLSIRNNPESVSVANEREFIHWAQTHNRDDLLKYADPEIKKTAIKVEINSGKELPGCALIRTRSLTVK